MIGVRAGGSNSDCRLNPEGACSNLAPLAGAYSNARVQGEVARLHDLAGVHPDRCASPPRGGETSLGGRAAAQWSICAHPSQGAFGLNRWPARPPTIGPAGAGRRIHVTAVTPGSRFMLIV